VGDHDKARAAYQEALILARVNEDQVGVATSLYRLARLARTNGADDEAVRLLTDALRIHATTGDGGSLSSLELAGGLAIEQGRGAAGARLLAAADALRERFGTGRPQDEAADYTADLRRLREALATDDFAAAWEQGASLSLDEAIALALRGRGSRERYGHGWASLSDMERQIVALVAEGLTNPEIGRRLFISPRTVQGYLRRVFTKLGYSSRRELRDAYRQRGTTDRPSS
jgi:DNA-binding CsgD family transcriptional regulator